MTCFGAYASTFWLDAYGPSLQSQQWSWPDPTDVANPVPVPDLAGRTPAAATASLASLGLTGAVATVVCGSGQPAGTVGYYEPRVATAGSAVTLCLSNGTAPDGSGHYPATPGTPATPETAVRAAARGRPAVLARPARRAAGLPAPVRRAAGRPRPGRSSSPAG